MQEANNATRGEQESTTRSDAEAAQTLRVPPSEPASQSETEPPEPPATTLGRRFRSLIARARQKQLRPRPIQRHQLRQDRTKAFIALALLTGMGAVLFFSLVSTAGNQRRESVRRTTPSLGSGPGGVQPGPQGAGGRSPTPLLRADVRNAQDGDAGAVTPEDIRNTARDRNVRRTSPPPPVRPTSLAPQPARMNPAPNTPSQALGSETTAPPSARIVTPAPAALAQSRIPERLAKPSLVFVRTAVSAPAPTSAVPAVASAMLQSDVRSAPLPAGTRLVCRLQAPVSTVTKAPVVAAIEYNYERDGEVVIPAGAKALGELEQANEQGYVSLHFQAIQMPDGTVQTIDGRSMGLDYRPLRGQVSGRNSGKRFVVRAVTGIGALAAAVVGPHAGTGAFEPITENALIRERLANNIALAGEQELARTAYQQNIAVTVPGNTRFYIVLSQPRGEPVAEGGKMPVPAENRAPGLNRAAIPSVQELRELMELRRELVDMYQQQQKMPVQEAFGQPSSQ